MFCMNFFLYSLRNFYDDAVIIMISLVLTAQSPRKQFPAATATLLDLGVTSKKRIS